MLSLFLGERVIIPLLFLEGREIVHIGGRAIIVPPITRGEGIGFPYFPWGEG